MKSEDEPITDDEFVNVARIVRQPVGRKVSHPKCYFFLSAA